MPASQPETRDATALVFLLSTLLTGGSQLVGVTAEVICGFMLGPVLTVVVVRWCTMARPFEAIEHTMRGKPDCARRSKSNLLLLL